MVTQNGAMHSPDGKTKKSSTYRALPQILAVTVKNILLMVYGMTLGFPTLLIPRLTGMYPEEKFVLAPEGLSWISSINLICVPLGCIVSGPITQPFGRKRSMQMVNLPFIGAWLLLYLSSEVWHVFLGLALTGLTGGLLEAPVLTYVAEVTQPHLRGMLSSTSTMAVIGGVLAQFLLGKFFHWRTVAAANIFLPAVAFICLFFIPESPHWLISQNRLLDARKSLAWLRGWTSLDEIEPEFKEIHRSIEKDEGGVDNPAFDGKTTQTSNLTSQETSFFAAKLEVLKKLTKRTFILPFATICFCFFTGHFGGTTPLQTYAIPIFATLKTPVDKYYATVLLGSVELAGCIICVIAVHYAGKRVLNFISMIGTAVCFFITAFYAYYNNMNALYIPSASATNISSTIANITNITNATIAAFTDDGTNLEEEISMSWLPMTCLVVAAFLNHICNRSLPWILIGEVFPNDIRAIASGLSGAMGYIFSFSANKFFLSIVSILTLPGTFWFFSGTGLVGCLVLYFILPETEGKHLAEITDHYAGVSKLGNDVRRKRKSKSSNKNGAVNQAYTGDVGKYNSDESKF